MRLERELLKDDLIKGQPSAAKIFRLFSRTTPWLIVESLRHNEMTILELSKTLKMTPSSVRRQLSGMQKTNILAPSNVIGKARYGLNDIRILKAIDLVNKIATKRIHKAEARYDGIKSRRECRRRQV